MCVRGAADAAKTRWTDGDDDGVVKLGIFFYISFFDFAKINIRFQIFQNYTPAAL